MTCGLHLSAINEEMLAHLLEKAIVLEEVNIDTLLRLFIAEEEIESRKILYELLRDCEHHKLLVWSCLKILKGAKYPESMRFKEYEFEDMLSADRSAVLKRVQTTLKDFYSYLLEDVKKAEASDTVNRNILEKISRCLQMLIEEKERHLKLIDKIWEF